MIGGFLIVSEQVNAFRKKLISGFLDFQLLASTANESRSKACHEMA
jgi:hypothetical protein